MAIVSWYFDMHDSSRRDLDLVNGSVPLVQNRGDGRDISGLSVYAQ